MPTKLLYDIEQLVTSNGKETGICRVSLELLRTISKEVEYDVYPLVTTAKGINAKEYLHQKGLDVLADKVVMMPFLKKTTQNYNWYKKLCAYRYILKHRRAYQAELKKYDAYISIFSPISPIVYNSGIKTKLIVHDLIPLKFPQFADSHFAKKYRHWIKAINADEIFCVSTSTKNDLLEFRPDLDENKIKVAHLAASNKFYPQKDDEIRRKYNIKTDNYILSVSDHNPRKNYCHLINSFILFKQKILDDATTLVIVGPKARDTKNIISLILNNSEYQRNIILAGFIPDEDMAAMYSGAEMFVYPSLYEGFGLPPLEAMSCGCPVISTNNSSLPEVCGDVALYISGKNEEETASQMAQLHKDTILKSKMSNAGIARAKQFSWQKATQIIFNLKGI